MANFFETVLTVLKSDQRFVAEDGTFLRNAVYEAAMKMDAKLIRLLLENEETSSRFFTDVDGVKVFDKTGVGTILCPPLFYHGICSPAIISDYRSRLQKKDFLRNKPLFPTCLAGSSF